MARANVGDDVGVPIGLDETVQLGTLAMGEINEKFPAALKDAVENILSFDYPGKTKREIVIKVTLAPSDDRTRADVEVGVTTKLAPRTPATTKLYFTPMAGEVVISEDNPQQARLEFK
jgi:hypothetical protein